MLLFMVVHNFKFLKILIKKSYKFNILHYTRLILKPLYAVQTLLQNYREPGQLIYGNSMPSKSTRCLSSA
jgi:hypothetical protein